MTELIVVLVMISLIVLLAQMNFFSLLTKNTFRVQAQELISAMQMAANAAAESGKRYEVIIDMTEQTYVLREITSPDLSEVLDEEIIVSNEFSNNCQAAYVLFDDGDFANEGRAKFRVGHSGWQYGGRIVLLDRNETPYSVVVNRLNRIVTLQDDEAALLLPKRPDEMLF
jgi:Tfp pilus assembly protein FimT